MNILVIGSGGREHAIAEAFARSKKVQNVIVAPGNAGIALQYQTIDLPSHQQILEYCLSYPIDIVFIGPETAIADGLSDYLREHQVTVIAPSQKAGRIETSKVFAKDLMHKYDIPTARYVSVASYNEAVEQLAAFTLPVVIKADGLAAGKGVVICNTMSEAQQELDNLLNEHSLGNAGNTVVIEEFLTGWEVSLFAITDGTCFQTTVFAQDHKQLLDGDKGPNTGGMGAFAPVPEAEPFRQAIEEMIVAPVIKALQKEGSLYQGILFCGLMITDEGIKVIEFNCRLGDPETQAILPLLETDIVDICEAIANNSVEKLTIEWKPETAVCVVLSSRGYPSQPDIGHSLQLAAELKLPLYFAGVNQVDGQMYNSGGRVLSVVGIAPDIISARAKVYQEIAGIEFEGKYFRNDIGLRENKFDSKRMI